MSAPTRILLLEDDAELREVLGDLLQLEGFEVFGAGDGAEAVAQASAHPFDILVFDVKLPGPDGLEVLARFKKENPDVLSVVMTGYATEADTLRALRLGVGDYLKKPFKSDLLLEAVRRLERELLGRRRLQERERTALELIVWSLEFLVGGLEFGQDKKLVECGRLARHFALGLGHANDVATELQAAVLYRMLEETGRLPRLPETVRALADEIGQPQAEETSLAGLGALCLQTADQPELVARLEALTGLSAHDTQLVQAGRERRHLLSLGRTLLASGEVSAAVEAFTQLAETSKSREAGQALLELSQLDWAAGRGEQSMARLRQLLALSPTLGPQAGAELELEAGLTSLGMGHGDGAQLLARSLEKLERLGLDGLAAQAVLGLRAAGHPAGAEEERFGAALAVENLDFLLPHAGWLLKALVKEQLSRPRPELDRLLLRLVREAPGAVSRQLGETQEPAACGLLLELIERAGPTAFMPALQRLFGQAPDEATRARVEQLIAGHHAVGAPTLRLFSLGPFEVWIGDQRVSERVWRTSRSRFMLACLALRAGKPVLSESIIEQFWPGVRPDAGKKNLSQTLSDMRKVLLEAGLETVDELVVRKHEFVVLGEEAPVWHDLESFTTELDKARQLQQRGELRQAYQRLRAAYGLVRGDYLEDCSMEWAHTQRREFERQTTECFELLAGVCRELGHYPELIEVALRLLERDPCHQPAHRLLMEAHIAQQRPELALRQYEQARLALQTELQAEPSTELMRVYQLAKMSL